MRVASAIRGRAEAVGAVNEKRARRIESRAQLLEPDLRLGTRQGQQFPEGEPALAGERVDGVDLVEFLVDPAFHEAAVKA